jgi:hypothetical protein
VQVVEQQHHRACALAAWTQCRRKRPSGLPRAPSAVAVLRLVSASAIESASNTAGSDDLKAGDRPSSRFATFSREASGASLPAMPK